MIQNQLSRRLPPEFFAQFPAGTELTYNIIPMIPSMDPPLRDAVRHAFADGLRVSWRVCAVIAAIGSLTTLGMKSYRLHTDTDRNWGLREADSTEKVDDNNYIRKEEGKVVS